MFQLLIAPEGIEIGNFTKSHHGSHELLIAPEGIEINSVSLTIVKRCNS